MLEITINNTINQQLATSMQHSYNQLTVYRLQEFQVPKIHGGTAYTEIISSTMDKYSTALVNRIEGDMTQWMANLYSLRLREVADQQDPQHGLEKGATDNLGLYVLQMCMNDNANPPVFPSTLSDFGNSDNGKATIQQVQDESNVDLRIIHNMSTLKAHHDTNQRRVENHYRKLHERIVHIETGSWVTMDKALARIEQLLQVPFATNDVGIITSIAHLVTISERLGPEHRLYETHWNSAKEQRLFNLVPKPSFIKKYIKLTNGAIKTLLLHVGLGTYVNDENTLKEILDLGKIKTQPGMIFSGYLVTDGYATSVPFQKPLTNNTEQLPELLPEDFKEWEFKYLNIWGADPGVSSIYVASNGSDNDVYHGRPDALDEDYDRTRLLTRIYDEHEIRRFSTVEYYTKAGYKKTMQKINMAKTTAIQTLENGIKTNRTTDLNKIQQYIDSVLVAFTQVTDFYARPEIQSLTFLNYQGRQRMDNELINIFVNGGKKYHPPACAYERLHNAGQQLLGAGTR
ncbi:hypothetical protein DFQ30_008651 [Apophysomyces sp. BC1015]|nr:hypothetical protein DFQ30_008651 [Apophysomyces sp. BC1015]